MKNMGNGERGSDRRGELAKRGGGRGAGLGSELPLPAPVLVFKS
jgi:hypothetical protein